MRFWSKKFCRIVMVIVLALVCASNAVAQKKDELARATALNQQVLQLYRQGRYADAIPLARQVLAIREKEFGTDHPSVANILSNLAVLYDGQGRYAEAEPLYKRSLTINEKALGPDHPDVATSLNYLGLLYYRQGRYAEA